MELLFRGDFANPVLIYWIAWWSALACFGMASTTAIRVRNHSQLFMGAMLFAAAWVLVAAAAAGRLDAVAEVAKQAEKVTRATSEIVVADRAIDVAGFLLVFVGAMLSREKSEDHWEHKLHWWLLAGALVFLILLVRPNNLMGWLFSGDNLKREMALGEVVGGIGFLSLTIGVWAVGTIWHRLAIIVTMSIWEAVSLNRTLQLWDVPKDVPRPHISAEQGYSFVTLRLIATYIVTRAILKAYRDWKLRPV